MGRLKRVLFSLGALSSVCLDMWMMPRQTAGLMGACTSPFRTLRTYRARLGPKPCLAEKLVSLPPGAGSA